MKFLDDKGQSHDYIEVRKDVYMAVGGEGLKDNFSPIATFPALYLGWGFANILTYERCLAWPWGGRCEVKA